MRLTLETALWTGQSFDIDPDWGSTLGSVHRDALGSMLGCMLGFVHMAALGALLGSAKLKPWCRLD